MMKHMKTTLSSSTPPQQQLQVITVSLLLFLVALPSQAFLLARTTATAFCTARSPILDSHQKWWRCADAATSAGEVQISNASWIRRRTSLSSSSLGGGDGPKSATTIATTTSSTGGTLDPLCSILWIDVRMAMNHYYRHDQQTSGNMSMTEWSTALGVWRRCLTKGRLPSYDDDFGETTWPPLDVYQPAIETTLLSLQVSRLTQRHPEAISSLLLSMSRLVVDALYLERNRTKEEHNGHEEKQSLEPPTSTDKVQEEEEDSPTMTPGVETMNELTQTFHDEWDPMTSGVTALDQLFGSDSSFLDGLIEFDDDLIDDDNMKWGRNSGVWHHTGWKVMEELQKALITRPDLQQLVARLGRRPTSQPQSRTSGTFVTHPAHPQGTRMSVVMDPAGCPDDMASITMSNSIQRMLPSEAVLLKSKTKGLRRSFLAKLVESRLWSQELHGYVDDWILPSRQPQRQELPSTTGGPLILGLDTSWSMSSRYEREQVSKAMALACVTMAFAKGRDCCIVAFSSESNVVQSNILSPTASQQESIEELLAFLQGSFGGGTDVTGALKHIMNTFFQDEDDNNTGKQRQNRRKKQADDEPSASLNMDHADLLLISDGEIPDPPVPQDVLEKLDMWRNERGVQVHGLLVGRNESIALERLCDETHVLIFDR